MSDIEPSSTSVFGIIPARWGSTRFPGKMLHPIAGKPLIQHVWERCQECVKLDRVVIATDTENIRDVALAFGAEVVMTQESHPSGTDRLAEAVSSYPEATHIINIQGDEPMIEPSLIDTLAETMLTHPEVSMATAANEITDQTLIADPNVVKCVLTTNQEALYFSRSPIPYQRSASPELKIYRHKGIYAYRRDFLEFFVQCPPSPLELAESLEQLRALEHGAKIKVVITDDCSGGIDTLEQANDLELLIKSKT